MNYKHNVPYVNETRLYLLPALYHYLPKSITNILRMHYLIAVGIHDNALDGSFILKKDKNYLFLLYNRSCTSIESFEESLHTLRVLEAIVCDYTVDDDPNLRMLVIEVPKELEFAFNKFIKGKYSEMYDKSFIEKVFKSKSYGDRIIDVFYKNSDALEKFIKKVKTLYGKEVDIDREQLKEYELPPSRKLNIFNSRGDYPIFIYDMKDYRHASK